MSPVTDNIVQVLQDFWASQATQAERLDFLHHLRPYIEKLETEDQTHLVQQIDALPERAPDDRPLLQSYLYYLTKEERFLEALAKSLEAYEGSLEQYHYLLWQIIQTIFLHQQDILPETKIRLRENYFRPTYLKAVQQQVLLLETSPSKGTGVRKVAIVLNQFLGPFHGPSQNALIIAAGLAQLKGLQIHLINANGLAYRHSLPYFKAKLGIVHSEFVGERNLVYEDPEFGKIEIPILTQAPEPFTPEKLLELANYLQTHAFDAIINIGDNLFLTEAFYQKLPIVTMTTNLSVPLIRSDYFLMIYNQLPAAEQAVVDQLPLQGYKLGWHLNLLLPSGPETITRAEWNLPEDAFVYAVVGHRLGLECEETFWEICERLLSSYQNAYLLFIGNPAPMEDILPKTALQNHLSRIRNVDFQTDLKAVYRICNAYLNPFRSGGGGSAMLAISVGLPVLTLDHCDVATHLPSTLCCQDKDAYEAMALRLARDPEYYRQRQQETQRLAEGMTSNRPQIEHLYEILCQLSAREW